MRKCPKTFHHVNTGDIKSILAETKMSHEYDSSTSDKNKMQALNDRCNQNE